MTDRAEESACSSPAPLGPEYAQLLRAVEAAVREGLRLITEEGVDVDALRFEVRPVSGER
ncbi:hypothetical protein L3Q65_00260 (plasmid) [Amycolatopsis sp. FU40]|uniref:hypothetical protein n=1 Tax=Amycolatopsis sp. FU40 TaxID=2914159 RepID=UPI001F396248|nr:hypothetical protein [Amycolatopsis sp. FU40]UKD50732.1 hypothetical protein L3Q65_00260 [Amycolatopsis sp. FU40]